MSGNRFKQGRAIFLAAIMVISMAAIGFAGSAAAATQTVDQAQPANIDIADGSTQTQDLISGGSINITTGDANNNIDVNVDISDIDTNSILGSSPTATVEAGYGGDNVTNVNVNTSSSRIEFEIQSDAVQTVDGTPTATIDTLDLEGLDLSSASSSQGLTYTIAAEEGGDGPSNGVSGTSQATAEFDITDSSGTVTNTDAGVTYTTIQNAIDDANSDETIEVSETNSGYASFVVDGDDPTGLTIQAASNEDPNVTVDSDADTLIEKVDDINVSGLTFDVNSGDIQLGDADAVGAESGLVFTNNTLNVDSAAETGVRVDSDSAEISGNEFTVSGDSGGTNTHAIQVGFNARSTSVTGNTITGDTDTASGLGIYVSPVRDDVDGATTISNNEITGFSIGLGLDTDDGTYQIQDNTISDAIDSDFSTFAAASSSTSVPQLNGETDLNAQIISVAENNTLTTTSPIGLESSPDTVVAGQSTTITTSVTGIADDEEITYALEDGDGSQLVSTGSTDAGQTSFNLTSDFSSGTDHTIYVGRTTSQANLGSDNNAGSVDITVEERNITQGVTVDGDAVYNQTVAINGTLVDANGDAVSGNTLQLRSPSDTVESIQTTGSDGGFEFTNIDLTDAGEWDLFDNTGGDEVDTFDIATNNATVTISADGNNFRNFDETYTINATSDTGAVLTQFDQSADGVLNDGDNVINITGPFVGTTVSEDTPGADVNVKDGSIVASGDDGTNTTYVLVDPSDDGGSGVVFDARPTTGTDAVSATLQVSDGGSVSDLVDGYEEQTNGDTSLGTPDLTGSDSVATTAADSDLIVDVTTDSIAVEGDFAEDNSTQSISVDVTGSDNNEPAPSNSLNNATVSISSSGGVGVSDQSVFLNGSNTAESTAGTTATFNNLDPEQGGTVTVDITGVTDDGSEVSDTGSVNVTGEQIQNLTLTSTNIDTTGTIDLEVTDTDGTAVLNRIVVLTHSQSNGFNVTDTNGNNVETDTLLLDAPNGEIYANTRAGTVIDDSFAPVDSTYTISGVLFQKTGDVRIQAANNNVDDDTIDVGSAISVSGVQAYNVTSDLDEALAGADDQHNITVTRDGNEVNGSDLTSLSTEYSQAGSTFSPVSESFVDTDDDNTKDTLRATVRAENASAPLNISVSDGQSRTGSTSLNVVEPVISTTLGGEPQYQSKPETTQNSCINPLKARYSHSATHPDLPAHSDRVYTYTRIHTEGIS